MEYKIKIRKKEVGARLNNNMRLFVNIRKFGSNVISFVILSSTYRFKLKFNTKVINVNWRFQAISIIQIVVIMVLNCLFVC